MIFRSRDFTQNSISGWEMLFSFPIVYHVCSYDSFEMTVKNIQSVGFRILHAIYE